jgi:hypothetical protein
MLISIETNNFLRQDIEFIKIESRRSNTITK